MAAVVRSPRQVTQLVLGWAGNALLYALVLYCCVAAFGPALAASAAETRIVGRAEVVFFEPEKFTDVRDSYMGDSSRTTYLDQIRDYVLE